MNIILMSFSGWWWGRLSINTCFTELSRLNILMCFVDTTVAVMVTSCKKFLAKKHLFPYASLWPSCSPVLLKDANSEWKLTEASVHISGSAWELQLDLPQLLNSLSNMKLISGRQNGTGVCYTSLSTLLGYFWFSCPCHFLFSHSLCFTDVLPTLSPFFLISMPYVHIFRLLVPYLTVSIRVPLDILLS